MKKVLDNKWTPTYNKDIKWTTTIVRSVINHDKDRTTPSTEIKRRTYFNRPIFRLIKKCATPANPVGMDGTLKSGEGSAQRAAERE
jgi:hypothetical protein